MELKKLRNEIEVIESLLGDAKNENFYNNTTDLLLKIAIVRSLILLVNVLYDKNSKCP